MPLEKRIKHLCFDCDGTFYQITDLIKDTLFIAMSLRYGKLTGQNHENYRKVYAQTNSHTNAFCKMNLSITEALKAYDMMDIAKMGLKKDVRYKNLFDLIEKKNYSYSVLSNASADYNKKIMEYLAIPIENFSFFLTPESEGVLPKPDLSGFKKVIELSGCRPNQILMLGDRINIDLVPAKELGMKTAYVWHEKSDDFEADYYLPTIFDLEKIL